MTRESRRDSADGSGERREPRPDWTDPDTFARALARADTREKGNYYEDFREGAVLDHDPGLVLTRRGSEAWAGQTLNHDPAYWRPTAARERGFDEPPVHPDYLLAATMGASVEDLSEKGGYFLGRTDLRYPAGPTYPGTELRVESEVVSTRPSGSRPDYGIVTWRTRGRDAETGDVVCSYERTNMIPRREPTDPVETDGGRGGDGETGDEVDDLPAEFVVPDGGHFEDFVAALDEAADRDAAVAYRHERGRTMDAVTVAALPLATLNTARQHHDANVMTDAPSGGIVAYGDVTRSTALAHARSDERTWREVGTDDERFHAFVTPGDTVYGFTVVRSADEDASAPRAGTVRFRHVAFDGRGDPVYSGTRIAEIERRT